MGLCAVKQHSESKTHKQKTSAAKNSHSMETFFVKKNSNEESQVILIEICKIFHCVKHNQSYNSLDCSFKLDTKIYTDSKIASKLSCGRTKSQAIVQNVLAPIALQKVIELLKYHVPKLFFSVQLDASNRKNVKLFPISVQFFTMECGLQNFLLQFCENSDESADGMFNMLNNSLKELKLDWSQVSSLSADNTNSNFGANHSLFTNSSTKNQHLLKGNCHAHVIHNCVKFSMDALSLDVENLILKIYSHFSISAKRREELKSFHEFTDCQWRELLRHVGTRWLSLNPCVERILSNYVALCSYFLSTENCPAHVKKLLKIDEVSGTVSPEVEIYLLFCNHILTVFETFIKKN